MPKDHHARNLRYPPYDPATMQNELQGLVSHLEHQRDRHGLTDDSWMSVADFKRFALLNHVGWKNIHYESFRLEGGEMFWLSDVHAGAIGRALRPTLKRLRIDITTLKADGFTVMANAASGDIQLDYLCIAHRSGDEVTGGEARGLARFVTQVAARSLSLWASGFLASALDTLAAELTRLRNTTLQSIDVCDLSKNRPDDKISHSGLDALVKVNRDNALDTSLQVSGNPKTSQAPVPSTSMQEKQTSRTGQKLLLPQRIKKTGRPMPHVKNGSLKYNGIYQSSYRENYWSYLRFYEDGTVLDTSTSGTSKDLRVWFNKENKELPCGTFSIKGNRVAFSVHSNDGVVDYIGENYINHLHLDSHSRINGHRNSDDYVFVEWRQRQRKNATNVASMNPKGSSRKLRAGKSV